jgi:hypothetical protein
MATSPRGGGGVVVCAELELFSLFGSVAELTVAVLVNVVPGAALAGMWKTIVKFAVPPAGTVWLFGLFVMSMLAGTHVFVASPDPPALVLV